MKNIEGNYKHIFTGHQLLSKILECKLSLWKEGWEKREEKEGVLLIFLVLSGGINWPITQFFHWWISVNIWPSWNFGTRMRRRENDVGPVPALKTQDSAQLYSIHLISKCYTIFGSKVLRLDVGCCFSILGRIIRVTDKVINYREWIKANYTKSESLCRPAMSISSGSSEGSVSSLASSDSVNIT